MANFDCYVRIYLPLRANGTPDDSQFGHYDLQIDGIGDASLPFDSHTNIKKPVFAFGGFGGKGYVKIFPETKTSAFYTGEMLLCKYHFTATAANVQSFVTTMQNMLTYQSKSNGISLYKVTSGPYQTFSANRYNSFGAVAAWCSGLGDSGLANIYNQYTNNGTGYMNYAVWAMFNTYFGAWRFTKLQH